MSLAVVKTMAESIVIDKNVSDILNEDNLLTLSVVNYGEVGFVKLSWGDSYEYWKEVEDNALLSTSERQAIAMDCYLL